LVKFLSLESARAHRALDDSLGCLKVAVECYSRAGHPPLCQIIEKQGVSLSWDRFSIRALGEQGRFICEAIEGRLPVFISYNGGSRPGRERLIYPDGLVRNPQGDYIVGRDERTSYPKRYFWDKVASVRAFD
jgi:DNA polymerase-3 subunit epsilon